jgi:LysM repeat protein
VVTVLLAEAALFVAALAVFGVLAFVLRIRDALRNRQGSAEQRIRDEAITAERVHRRLAELAPSQEGLRSHAARAVEAPAAAPRSVVASVPRRQRRGPVTLVAAGILIVLLAVAVLTPHAVPGGVLGVRGVPSSPTSSGRGARASGSGIAVRGSTGAVSLPAGRTTPGASGTPTSAAQTPIWTPTARPSSPIPAPTAAIAQASRTEQATVGPCGASGCVVYVVRSGDTVGRIARRLGVSIQAILAINPQLRDPNVIVTGQTLLLPSGTP